MWNSIVQFVENTANNVKNELGTIGTGVINSYSSVTNFIDNATQSAANFLKNGWNIAYEDLTSLNNTSAVNVVFTIDTLGPTVYNLLANATPKIISAVNSALSSTGSPWQIKQWGNYPLVTTEEIRFTATKNNPTI